MKHLCGWRHLASAALCLISTSFFLQCAQIVAPPGGEVDKTGPFLMTSVPKAGSVNVPPGREVTLFFSETVVKPATGRSVLISPRPEQEPKVKWKSDRVVVVFAEEFAPNQTYIISAGAGITDLRKNKLDSGLTMAFSTGPTIDAGHVGGLIFADGKAKGGLLVGLYDMESLSLMSLDSLYGTYLTETNAEGVFAFDYLPEKEYRLLAFADANNSERLNPLKESYAVTDRPVIVGSDIPLDSLIMDLTSSDTSKPQIISAAYTPDGLVKVRLSMEIPLLQLQQNPDWLTLVPAADSSRSIRSLALLETDIEKASAVSFYAGRLDTGAYALQLNHDSLKPVMAFPDFVVRERQDSQAPEIAAFYPDKLKLLPDEIRIEFRFTEAVDTTVMTAETFVLLEKPSTVVPVRVEWVNPLYVRLIPEDTLTGEKYRVDVTEFELADMAGNLLGDSLRSFDFSMIDEESLGWVAGDVVISLPGREGDQVKLTLDQVGSKQSFEVSATGGQFKTRVPAGKYLMSGFIDSDGNGLRDLGAVSPFRHAETQAFSSDTISVRERFETAGVIFEFR